MNIDDIFMVEMDFEITQTIIDFEVDFGGWVEYTTIDGELERFKIGSFYEDCSFFVIEDEEINSIRKFLNELEVERIEKLFLDDDWCHQQYVMNEWEYGVKECVELEELGFGELEFLPCGGWYFHSYEPYGETKEVLDELRVEQEEKRWSEFEPLDYEFSWLDDEIWKDIIKLKNEGYVEIYWDEEEMDWRFKFTSIKDFPKLPQEETELSQF